MDKLNDKFFTDFNLKDDLESQLNNLLSFSKYAYIFGIITVPVLAFVLTCALLGITSYVAGGSVKEYSHLIKYYYTIALCFLSLPFWFLTAFSRKLNSALKDEDQKGFEKSLIYLKRFIFLSTVVIIVTLISFIIMTLVLTKIFDK